MLKKDYAVIDDYLEYVSRYVEWFVCLSILRMHLTYVYLDFYHFPSLYSHLRIKLMFLPSPGF